MCRSDNYIDSLQFDVKGNSESGQSKRMRPTTATTHQRNRKLTRPQSGRPDELQGLIGNSSYGLHMYQSGTLLNIQINDSRPNSTERYSIEKMDDESEATMKCNLVKVGQENLVANSSQRSSPPKSLASYRHQKQDDVNRYISVQVQGSGDK